MMSKKPTAAPSDVPDARPTTKRLDVVAIDLSCALSDDERNARSRALVQEMGRKNRTLDRHKELKIRMKSEVGEHDSQIDLLQAQASTGFETRPVSCDVVADFERGVAETIRRDTGEIVKSRPLETSERQGKLVDADPDQALAEAFTNGQIAGREGRSDNPYPESSEQAAEWDRGFRSVTPDPKSKAAKPPKAAPLAVASDDAPVAPTSKAPE